MSVPLTPRLATLLLVSTMTIMAGATISPALPAIRDTLEGRDGADLLARLVLTIPALFTAISAAVAGSLIDRFGRRVPLLAALVLYGVAGAGGGLAPSIEWLLASRALLGLSVGFVMTISVTLIGDYWPGPERGTVMGRQAAFTGLGGLVFLVAGGALADLSWRAPFAIYLVALVLLPFAARHLDEPVRADAPGADAGGRAADGARAPAGGTPVAVALLCALVFVSMAAFYMIPVQLPFLLVELGLESGLLAGLAVAFVTAAGAASSLAYGAARARLGHGGVCAVLYACMATGYALTASATTFTTVALAMVVFGLGLGLLIPNANDWMSELAGPDNRGTLLGLLTTSLFLGQFLSPIVLQPLVDGLSLGGAFGAVGAGLGTLAAGFALGAGARARARSRAA